MVCHAIWKTWPSGLSHNKNLGLRPRFLSTWVPRAMFLTWHGKPWLKPITWFAHYAISFRKLWNCMIKTDGWRTWLCDGESWIKLGLVVEAPNFIIYGQLISRFHSQISAYTSESAQSAIAIYWMPSLSKTMVLWRKREAFRKNQKMLAFHLLVIEIGFRWIAKPGPTDLVHTGSKYKHIEAGIKFYRQHHR